ncbi:amidohydrolase family protein [Anaerosporobacter faecicola]|uniref:amidohydrolase family protein n=1 Tax=Anaerosporobacter faecicola TaxID=2718714 RepID=UPI0014399C9C|nr:amidohydrolase family protein [Anaerosporobacter faecicola]
MIIDTHVHIGDQVSFNMTEDMVLASMEKYHIDYSIVSNIEGVEYNNKGILLPKEKQKSQIDVFQKTLRFAKAYPEQIGVMPWVKPVTERVDQEFVQLMEENIQYIRGIKLHSFYSRIGMDDARLQPYIDLARVYNLPMVCHTGGCEEADPIHMYRAAKANPEVRFVMVHMGLGTDNKEAIELMEDAPNLYADTTWVPIESSLEVIRRYGSKRIVFGSDMPIDGVDTYYCNPKGERSLYRDYFEKLEEQIGSEAYEDLMYKNARRIFHVPVN